MDRIDSVLRTKGGATMVEVMAAFLILVIILGIFSQSAVLAGRMIQHSEKRRQESRNLEGSYYLEGQGDPEDGKAGAVTPSSEPVILNFQSETGASFQIPAKVRVFAGEGASLYDVVGVRPIDDGQ